MFDEQCVGGYAGIERDERGGIGLLGGWGLGRAWY